MRRASLEIAALFDHLVGAQEERWRDSQSERARCLQIYDQLELGWLLDRQIDRFCAAQNLVDETDDMPAPNPVRIMTMKGDIAFNFG